MAKGLYTFSGCMHRPGAVSHVVHTWGHPPEQARYQETSDVTAHCLSQGWCGLSQSPQLHGHWPTTSPHAIHDEPPSMCSMAQATWGHAALHSRALRLPQCTPPAWTHMTPWMDCPPSHMLLPPATINALPVRVTLRWGHLYTEILWDKGEPNRYDTPTQW